MSLFAQVVVRDQGVTYKPGDEIPESLTGLDDLIEGGAVVEEYMPPEADPTQPDTSDLTPTSPDQSVTDADSAGAGEETL